MMQWEFILRIFLRATFYLSVLRMMVPIALAAIGEVIGERAGVVNIGLEGIIMLGAVFSVYVGHMFLNTWIAILAGLGVGILVGLLHAALTTYLAGDQIIDGVGLNMLAFGLGVVMIAMRWGMYGTTPSLPFDIRVPTFRGLSPFVPFTVIAALAAWFVLEKTSWGLRLKACGEDPVAAEAAGISVFKTRTIATVIGSALTSLAGVFLGIDWLGAYTRDISAGRGFIALALVVFSSWNPVGAVLGGLVFGFFYAFSLSIPSGIVPDQLLYVMPYVVTLLITIAFVARSRPPAAVGRPYKKE